MTEKRLMLIEPDPVLAKNYTKAAQSAGLVVKQTGDAQMALSEIDSYNPDIICMELQLAEHNGFELLHELRSYNDLKHIPIILLTFVAEHDIGLSKKQLSKVGVVRYLYKPTTSLKKLTSVLREVIP